MATFLCISSYFKGADFLIACKEAGNTVFLVTSKCLQAKEWPTGHIDEIFYIQEKENLDWNMDDLINGTAYLMRTRKIDRIVALDDFDVEKAALVRETFRIPGMGQTTGRHFRDKLAMRVKAAEEGINVPAFTGLFNDAEIDEYLSTVKAPWLVKPRSEASATGIEKCHTAEEVWNIIDSIGHNRHNYLLEQFRPGDVYHVDSINENHKVVFCQVSKYVNTPLEVAHGGGIFRSAVVEYGSEDDKILQKMNAEVMEAFGMNYSASHTEFIKCHEDGKFYFLETSSRVGGANLAEMVYYASGVQLWKEWAKVESHVALGTKYQVPKREKLYAGIVISLSKDLRAKYDEFTAPEVVWKLHLDHHVGMIIKSKSRQRVMDLLDEYTNLIQKKYHASVPAKGKVKS